MHFTYQIVVQWFLAKGSFNNYVDKKRGEGVSRKSTLGHVTKGRYHVNCPQLSTQGERGQNSVKFGLHSC